MIKPISGIWRLYHLGLMYEQGLGVKADPDKAMEYYQATVERVAGTGYEDLDDYCVKARKKLEIGAGKSS